MVVDYKLSILAALVALIMFTIAAAVILTFQGADPTRIATIIGLATPTIVALLSLMRSETNGKDLGVANERINGHLQEQTQVVQMALQALKDANPPVGEAAIQAAQIVNPNPQAGQ